MAKRKEKKPKTTLDYCAMLDLDLDEFFRDAVRDRSLFSLLESIGNACSYRADYFERELEKELHPSVRPNAEDEAEFFREAEVSIWDMLNYLKDSWKGRELPTCADGHMRLRSQRSADAMQIYLTGLLTTLNDPNAPAEDWSKAAALFAHEGEGMIWYHRETGAPDFELAKLFRESSADLIDPRVTEDVKRQIAADLQAFIVGTYERRANA